MPGYRTTYLRNKELAHACAGTAFTAPTTLYLGLSRSAANVAGSISEPSGGTYARTAVTCNTTNWPARVDGTLLNGVALAIVAAAGSAGTALSMFIADASSGGNVLFSIDLVVPKAVGPGAPDVTFAPGALVLG